MLSIFLVVLVNLIGFGIVIPLLPFYAERFGADAFAIGLLMAAYSLAQLIATPLWGRISDSRGRKPVLLITLGGTVLAYLWLAYAESLTALFAARIFGGLMAGNISAAFAYVADITTRENRARGMGLVGAAFGLGFIAGPAIGGVLAGADPATADFRSPGLAAAALSAIALVLTVVILRESRKPGQAPADAGSRHPILRRPALALPIALIFLSTFVFAGMEATFALWSAQQFGWGPLENGYLFASVGLASAVFQGGVVGHLTRRFGERRLVSVGAVALAFGLFMLPFSSTLGLLALAMGSLVFGFSMVTPALSALVSLAAGEDEQGAALGISRSGATLGRVLGPAWAGFLFEHAGRAWPYWAGALVMAGVSLLAARLARPSRAEAPASGKA